MTTLPSFVELMASLGLHNSAEPASNHHQSGPVRSGRQILHSRSSSNSSLASVSSALSTTAIPSHPSINIDEPQVDVMSQRETSPDWELERRHARIARYSPYYPTISHARKRSVPAIKEELVDVPSRALSTSPYLSPATCIISRRSSSIAPKSSSRRPHKLTLSETELSANTPISTFVRRKTPQTSPTSPTFPRRRRKRSSSPTQPVSIPTLPIMFPPSPTSKYHSSDMDDEDMQDVSDTSSNHSQWQQQANAVDASRLPRASDTGTRISVFSRPDELSNTIAHVTPLPLA